MDGTMHKGLCTNLCGPFGPNNDKNREKGTNFNDFMQGMDGPMHKGLCTNLCGPFGPFGAKKGLLDDNLVLCTTICLFSCKEWTDQCTKVCAQTFVDLLGLLGPKRGSKLAIIDFFFIQIL